MLHKLKGRKTVSQKEQHSQVAKPLVKAALKTKAEQHLLTEEIVHSSVHGNRTELTYKKNL
jgi:hypothetical protein